MPDDIPDFREIFSDRDLFNEMFNFVGATTEVLWRSMCHSAIGEQKRDDIRSDAVMLFYGAVSRGLVEKVSWKPYVFVIIKNTISEYIGREMKERGAAGTRSHVTAMEEKMLRDLGVNTDIPEHTGPGARMSVQNVLSREKSIADVPDGRVDIEKEALYESEPPFAEKLAAQVERELDSPALSPLKRAIGKMYFLDAMTEQQIAEALGKSQSTVSGHVADVRKLLGQRLREKFPEIREQWN
ncbi:MAG TPA: sigma-70 family RNA polymerase sigma factor [Spirochaetota bacterium]|nr:sigma-70 family RNA polymerase sigma factor [Spirochaetota bacterium]HQP50220.1 sigma-70 family RNA polymerase sigma factor [Spirochaetota bacterium]